MKVRIFCLRTMSWWNPNARGYTSDPKAAGLFEYSDAENMSRDSLLLQFPSHAIVPLPWSEVSTSEGETPITDARRNAEKVGAR